MELLIIGAGAIGSVYGYFASQHPGRRPRITYLIKPSHREDLKKGLQLYFWKGRRAKPILFTDFSVIESMEEVANRKFDAVLITLPSDKFRAEGWIESLLGALDQSSPQARIWSLQPGTTDQDFLRSKMGAKGVDRVVKGVIPIISYLAPLPGETFSKPGYAFYIPKFAKAVWQSKNKTAAEEVSEFFNAAGFHSKVADAADTPVALFPEALLRSVVAGLERSEWSVEKFLNGENIRLAGKSIREALEIRSERQSPGWVKFGSSPFAIRSAVRLAEKILPFNFETYMRTHFTKVGRQMHMHLEEIIAAGKKLGKSTESLSILRGEHSR